MHLFSTGNLRYSLAASLLMASVMGIVRFFFATPIPPDFLYSLLSRLLGIPFIFNLIHNLPFSLDRSAKYILYGLAVLIFLLFFFFIGLFQKTMCRFVGYLGTAIIYSTIAISTTGLVLLPLQGLGFFGLSPNNLYFPVLSSHLWAGALGFIFAFPAFLFKPKAFRPNRRQAIRKSSLGLLAFFVSASGLTFLQKISADNTLSDGFLKGVKGLSERLTPTKKHYQVSKNIFNPSLSKNSWTLKVIGRVKNSLDLTLDDLKALPSVERPSGLICISNPVGGSLIGNSLWTGVRLATILEIAEVKNDANEVVARAADNYSDSFPLDAALNPGTILAFLHNGDPLTRNHGYPVRILIPGIYGIKNVKWVKSINLASTDYLGYWQTRGWSDEAVVETMSRIDTKTATILPNGQAAIGGIAFAGLKGISSVEVSIGNEIFWQKAHLEFPSDPYSWTRWTYAWEAESGRHTVTVRATDGSGLIQTPTRRKPLPDGATGHHSLRIMVPS